MPRRWPSEVQVHLDKACEAALLAVETYNRPATTFRSGGYIVLMCIAWTALFHATFFRKGVKPFYRDLKNPRRYARVDGDYKAWELATCIQAYYGDEHTPQRENLRFFIPLRNKIEHRSMPQLDVHIFGECQALLLNFEDFLYDEFGARHCLNTSLSLALQFSRMRDGYQDYSMQRNHGRLAGDLLKYISAFRSALSIDTLSDQRYSFKVFLIPKTVNHPSQADVAVEWVKYEPDNPDYQDAYERIVALVKPGMMQVANAGRLKPTDVCEAVRPIVQQVVGAAARFEPSAHHARAHQFYKVRPPSKAADPRATDSRFCQYDEPHKDYVYTSAWRDFLIDEMRKPGQYELVMKGRS
jgi:hypothetical protein